MNESKKVAIVELQQKQQNNLGGADASPSKSSAPSKPAADYGKINVKSGRQVNNADFESTSPRQETEPNELDLAKKKGKSLTAFSAGLALLSAIVGGGIVGIPFAMFHTGIPLGVILTIGLAVVGWYTGSLYLRIKDLSPTYVESMYELCYVTMGAASIYLLSVIVLISGVGCTMIYFIVFSNISKSLAELAFEEGTENMLTGRTFYVIALAVIMTPLCLKKRLAEMKIVSILLFVSIAIFILIFLVQLLTLGSIENHDETYGQYYSVDFGMDLITGFNIIVLANAYHINLFPTYNSLGPNKSNKAGLRSVAVGSGLSTVIYVSLGILSIYTFGSDLKSSVLKNVDQEQNVYSYIIRISFLLVLAFHIPYIFFPTKESFLIIFDEAKNKSMAKAIKAKLQKRENGNTGQSESATDSTQDEEENESSEGKSDGELAYLKMPAWKYYFLTMSLYVGCILASIFIDDIAAVFEFVGAFGLSLTSFTLPGIMYLLMLRNPNAKHQEIETDKQRRWNKAGSISVITLSLFNMFLVIYKQLVVQTKEIQEESTEA